MGLPDRRLVPRAARHTREMAGVAGVGRQKVDGRERNVLRDQALQSGKPADIVEKMLEGEKAKLLGFVNPKQATIK